jgi:hypothetical protein
MTMMVGTYRHEAHGHGAAAAAEDPHVLDAVHAVLPRGGKAVLATAGSALRLTIH